MGVFCGRITTKNKWYAYRHDGSTLTTLAQTNGATRINNSGDAPIHATKQFYYQGKGLLNLGDLVKLGSATDLQCWSAASGVFWGGNTERGALNADTPEFAAMCGELVIYNSSSSLAVLLTPFPVQ